MISPSTPEDIWQYLKSFLTLTTKEMLLVSSGGEARDAAKHPTRRPRTAPRTNNEPAPNVRGAKVAQPDWRERAMLAHECAMLPCCWGCWVLPLTYTCKLKSIKSAKLGRSRGHSGNAFASTRSHFFKVTQPTCPTSLKERRMQK